MCPKSGLWPRWSIPCSSPSWVTKCWKSVFRKLQGSGTRKCAQRLSNQNGLTPRSVNSMTWILVCQMEGRRHRFRMSVLARRPQLPPRRGKWVRRRPWARKLRQILLERHCRVWVPLEVTRDPRRHSMPSSLFPPHLRTFSLSPEPLLTSHHLSGRTSSRISCSPMGQPFSRSCPLPKITLSIPSCRCSLSYRPKICNGP